MDEMVIDAILVICFVFLVIFYIKWKKVNNNMVKKINEKRIEETSTRRIPSNVVLPSWNDIFNREMKIDISLGGDSIKDYETNEEYEAYQYLLDNQKDIIVNIVNELYKQYPDLRKEYGYSKEEEEEYMPDVNNLDEYLKLINPHTIHILNTQKDGHSYYGIEFSCKWDEDHGVGVMMHKSRIVEIGLGDSAVLNWKARRDLKDSSN